MPGPWRTHRGQRISCESWLFASTAWGPEIEPVVDAVLGPFTHWASHRPLFSKTSWQNVAIILWYSGLNKMYDRNYFHRFLTFPNGAIWKKKLIPLVICLTFNFFSIFIVLRWDLTQPRLIFCFWRGRGWDSVSLCRPGCPRNLAL